MKRLAKIALLAVVVVVVLIAVSNYLRADFLEFDRQREAWHRRCDAYVDQPVKSPAAAECQRELEQLTAYAKRKGWQ